MLEGKNIILGVTGGIAAYKALELTRLLKKEGACVWPVMTDAATKFIGPLSLATLAGNPVYTDIFTQDRASIDHIELADRADLLAVVPATANLIGKVASGIADNLLTTVIMASPAPVLIAPAMNHRMYANPVVRANIEKLEELGYLFVGPERGELACGWEGEGRLAKIEDVMDAVKAALSPKDLEGEKVLVTAGATREPIDPVRFISNASSGKMGYALARAARRRGAEVVLVSGPVHLADPPGVTVKRVESSAEMRDEVLIHYPQSTVVMMAAAVSDFRPVLRRTGKIKKGTEPLALELERTPDILMEMGRNKDERFLVGFALETEDLVGNATEKLREKNLDIIVANGPEAIDSDTSRVTLIDRGGGVENLSPMDKEEIAERLLDKVVSMKKAG